MLRPSVGSPATVNRLWPSKAFSFEAFGALHTYKLRFLTCVQVFLNQDVKANEDVKGFSVMSRTSFIIAAAVGRQLAAQLRQ
jgi:hypothetical protein